MYLFITVYFSGFPKREDIPLYNLVQRPRSGVYLFVFSGRSSIRFTCHISLESSDLEEFTPLLFWGEGGDKAHISHAAPELAAQLRMTLN